jgi:hypothetical protein
VENAWEDDPHRYQERYDNDLGRAEDGSEEVESPFGIRKSAL